MADADCKIYVGGINYETSNAGLSAYFSQFGEVADSIVMMDKMTGRPRGFGFVTFKEPSAANAAIGTSHTLDGRDISCKKAVRETRGDPMSGGFGGGGGGFGGGGGGEGTYNAVKIFVGGLPATCDQDKFIAFFGQFGAIQEAVVMMDQQTQRHRGFGYVTFAQSASVDLAMETQKQNTIDGKWVEVKRCIDKDKMPPGGKGGKGGKGDKGYGKGQDYGGGCGMGGYGAAPQQQQFQQMAGGYGAGGYGGGCGGGYGGGCGGGYGGAPAPAAYGAFGGYGCGAPAAACGGYGAPAADGYGCGAPAAAYGGYGAAPGGLGQQTFAPPQAGFLRAAPY